ncbi:MAG: TerD family protein [Oscillospiraceae bacterium]|nr:TerD family protein [Oscillospiraceae bacterium]
MAVNLIKGQKIDLTKNAPGLKHIMVGLGWDEAKQGFKLSKLFGKGGDDFDCDASAILINEKTGKAAGKNDLVYFGNLTHKSEAVKHMGDNLTGEGDGDDEQIFVDLTILPGQYSKIVFVVNIYEPTARNQDFGMIENAFIRLGDNDTGNALCIYNLSENYKGRTAMIFGELYRHGSEWKFSAIGEGTNDDGVGQLLKRYC